MAQLLALFLLGPASQVTFITTSTTFASLLPASCTLSTIFSSFLIGEDFLLLLGLPLTSFNGSLGLFSPLVGAAHLAWTDILLQSSRSDRIHNI
jgi:hypothetical protein